MFYNQIVVIIDVIIRSSRRHGILPAEGGMDFSLCTYDTKPQTPRTRQFHTDQYRLPEDASGLNPNNSPPVSRFLPSEVGVFTDGNAC